MASTSVTTGMLGKKTRLIVAHVDNCSNDIRSIHHWKTGFIDDLKIMLEDTSVWLTMHIKKPANKFFLNDMSDPNCIKLYMDITVKDFLEEKKWPSFNE